MPAAKVVFVNRFYWPDQSATSQILGDLAPRLVAAGLEVHVVTSRQRFDQPGARLPATERIAGVQVHRVFTSTFGRDRLAGRAVDYASFYAASGWRLLWLLRRGDVVVAKTDPPMISIMAWWAARLRGAVLVNWMQDVFPEIATALGANPLPGWASSLVTRLRDATLRAARNNVVISLGMLQRIAQRGVPATRIAVIENWAIDAAREPLPTSASQLRRGLGDSIHFVVAYSGNFGRAHEFDTLIGAAEQLRDDPQILFLMIGAGARLAYVKEQAAARGLANVRFLPHQPRANLADALAAADLHVVTLLPGLDGLVMPSKLYGILAAARPVLFIGEAGGSTAQWLAHSGGGLAFGTGDIVGAAQAIRRLAAAPEECEALGRRGHEAYAQGHGPERAALRWRELLVAAGQA